VHDLELPRGELDGFLPLFHTLEFYGLCPACRQRQAAQ
jgi:Fur family ferric uptake transcriptional regulator